MLLRYRPYNKDKVIKKCYKAVNCTRNYPKKKPQCAHTQIHLFGSIKSVNQLDSFELFSSIFPYSS